MKQRALSRSKPLGNGGKPRTPRTPQEGIWKAPRRGMCAVCHRPCWLERHHVLLRQIVRREDGSEWDLSNSLDLCRLCHARHHSAFKRIPIELVPAAAVAFAEELLGVELATAYFARHYAP